MTHKIVARVSIHAVEGLQHARAVSVVLPHRYVDPTHVVLLVLLAVMLRLAFVAPMLLKNVYRVLVVILRVYVIMPVAHLDKNVVILLQVSAVQVIYAVEPHQTAPVVSRHLYVLMELRQILQIAVVQGRISSAVQVVVVVQ